MRWGLLTSFLLFVSVVFLVLVEIGNTSRKPVLKSTYFIKLDLSNIIPVAVPDSLLINSIAETLGLHDFYQVGLWNFCEGYNGQGITQCSAPKTLWWFNPVEILQSELLAGASSKSEGCLLCAVQMLTKQVALPAQVTQILDLIREISHFMFALFLVGACLSTVMIFVVPLAVYSRWVSLPVMIFTFLAALCTTVATVIATAMFIIMRNAVTSVTQLNIGADLGIQMFVFMWIAAGASILAWIIQLGECCCCASRRDVKTGRKKGSKKAWGNEAHANNEKPQRQRGMIGGSK